MALVTANGLDVSWLNVVRPQQGAWHLDATVHASSGIAQGDAVTVAIGGGAVELAGRATRAAVHEDLLQLRVVAGNAGLATTAPAKFYQGAKVQLVVDDLLQAAGEQLALLADTSILGELLPNWSTFARPVGVELQTLLGTVAPDAVWRSTGLGAIWLGRETWPESDQAFELLERDASRRRITIGCEVPSLAPGETLDGERIGDVEYLVSSAGVTVWARLT